MKYREFKRLIKEELNSVGSEPKQLWPTFTISQTTYEDLEPYVKYGKIHVPDPHFPLDGTIIDLKDWETYKQQMIETYGPDFTMKYDPLEGSIFGGEFVKV